MLSALGEQWRDRARRNAEAPRQERRPQPQGHPGVLAAKVRDFGSNLLKCARAQMGTKPAKVGHLAPGAI